MVGDSADTLIGSDGTDTAIMTDAVGVDVNLASNQIERFYAGSGDDRIYGSSNSEMLSGGRGNDWLEGGAGNDTYAFNRGDGQDVIADYFGTTETITKWRWETFAESDGEGGTDYERRRVRYSEKVDTRSDAGRDVLTLGSGIAITDLILRMDGDDLVIGIRDAASPNTSFDGLTDTVRITNWNGWRDRIETFAFADGSSIDVSGMIGMIANTGDSGLELLGADEGNWITGGSGDDIFSGGSNIDVLNGGSGNDLLFGGESDDYLIGGDGADTARYIGLSSDYTIGVADGVLTVSDTAGSEGTDRLNGIELLEFSDVTISFGRRKFCTVCRQR